MNWSAELVALVPPGPVTVTSTVPDPAGEVTVIEVGELTVTPVAALPPKETVSPAAKFVPVTVTGVPPDTDPEAGETALTVGAGEVSRSTSRSPAKSSPGCSRHRCCRFQPRSAAPWPRTETRWQ